MGIKRFPLLGWVMVLLAVAVLSTAVSAKTVVQIVFPWPAAGPAGAMQTAAEAFEKENPDIDVEVILGKEDKMLAMVAAGTPPDIITGIFGSNPSWMALIEPLDKYMAGTDIKSKFNPLVWEPFIKDGSIYELPAFEGGPKRGFVYNQTLFDLAGLTYPSDKRSMTWDEVGALAKKLTKVDPNGKITQIGYQPREAGSWGLYVLGTQSAGVNWFNFDTFRSELNKDWATNSLEAFKRNFYEPWGQPAVDAVMAGRGAWTVNANAPFPSQISAMTVTGYYAIGELRLTAPGGRFGASWIPTLTGKKQQSVSSYGVAMLKTSKNKDATWRVMKYMSSPEATKIFYEKNGWLGGLHKDLGKYIDPRKDPGLMWFLQSIEQVDTVTNFPGPVADISGPANTVWTDAFEKGIRNQGDIRTILQEGNDRVNTIAAEVQRKSGK